MRPPKTLPPDAKEFWQHNAPILSRDGRLTDATLTAFVMLCTDWQNYQDAIRDGADPNKLVALSKTVMSGMKEFGMTPLARRRLKIDADDTPADIGAALRKVMEQ